MWVKIDDQFADHPKVLSVGPLAGWLHICALCYCGRYLTDGFIPAGQVRKLADLDHPETLVEKLMAAGMWEPADGGYRIHDYLDYNPSREKVIEERRQKAERQERWRKTKEEQGALRDGLQDASVTPAPYPSPYPINTTTGEASGNGSELGAIAPEVAKREKKPRKPPTRSEADIRLMDAFCQATGYNLPLRVQDANWWYATLREIPSFVDGDTERAVVLIRQTVDDMRNRREPLAIKDPHSIIGMARSLAAKASKGYVL